MEKSEEHFTAKDRKPRRRPFQWDLASIEIRRENLFIVALVSPCAAIALQNLVQCWKRLCIHRFRGFPQIIADFYSNFSRSPATLLTPWRHSAWECRRDLPLHLVPIKYFKQALLLAPGRDLFFMSIGVAYIQLGENERGIRFLERAANTSPKNGRIRKNLEAAYQWVRN